LDLSHLDSAPREGEVDAVPHKAVLVLPGRASRRHTTARPGTTGIDAFHRTWFNPLLSEQPAALFQLSCTARLSHAVQLVDFVKTLEHAPARFARNSR
jgi:hypothetical protein